VFYGKILGINDLVSLKGTTPKELKKSFHEAVDDDLKTCRELKRNLRRDTREALIFGFLLVYTGKPLIIRL
jgi:predicted HicB family RNase H-like nuclease